MPKAPRIFVVEDDESIRMLLEVALRSSGYRVSAFPNAADALAEMENTVPDAAVLDIMLDGMDGITALKLMRANARLAGVPVMMLTAKDSENDKIIGLDAGADDYITKPFGTFELLARIRTAIRHNNKLSDASQNANRPYSADGLTIDFERRLVTLRDQEIHLTRVEYKIVSLLAKNSGKVMTYDTLIDQVWGPYADDNNRILRVNMANIRRKIEENPGEPKYIFTELGVGYRMLEDGN